MKESFRQLGFLNPKFVDSVLKVWPSSSWEGWHRYSGEMGEKLASKPGSLLPAEVYVALIEMAWLAPSHAFSFIDFRLHGAGMHWILPEGELPRHLDSERHPDGPWIRAHSIVCFLEPSDGLLVLEDGERVITPEPGKVVMFPTQDNWHWVTKTSTDRRTLALFTYRDTADPEVWNLRTRARFSNE